MTTPITFAEWVARLDVDDRPLTAGMKRGEQVVRTSAARMGKSFVDLEKTTGASTAQIRRHVEGTGTTTTRVFGRMSTDLYRTNRALGSVSTAMSYLGNEAMQTGLLITSLGVSMTSALLPAAAVTAGLLALKGILVAVGSALAVVISPVALVAAAVVALGLALESAADPEKTWLRWLITDWSEGVGKAEAATAKLTQRLREQRGEMDKARMTALRATTTSEAAWLAETQGKLIELETGHAPERKAQTLAGVEALRNERRMESHKSFQAEIDAARERGKTDMDLLREAQIRRTQLFTGKGPTPTVTTPQGQAALQLMDLNVRLEALQGRIRGHWEAATKSVKMYVGTLNEHWQQQRRERESVRERITMAGRALALEAGLARPEQFAESPQERQLAIYQRRLAEARQDVARRAFTITTRPSEQFQFRPAGAGPAFIGTQPEEIKQTRILDQLLKEIQDYRRSLRSGGTDQSQSIWQTLLRSMRP